MRSKEYNRNNVLEKCITLFWTEGFGATSFDKIVDVTGVNRASLYNEFKNKNILLISSIELYLERYSQKQLELINLDGSAESLLKFYKSNFSKKENPKHPMGCYLISMATEIGGRNQEVAKLFSEYLKLLNQKFKAWAQAKTSSKEIQDSVAEILGGLYCSANVVCPVSSPDQNDRFLNSNISSALSCLEN